MFLKSFLGLISYLYTQWYFVQPIKWVWVLHLHFLTLISHNGEGKDEWILYWPQLDFTCFLLLKTKNEKKEPPHVSAWNINVCTTFHGIWVREDHPSVYPSIHPSINPVPVLEVQAADAQTSISPTTSCCSFSGTPRCTPSQMSSSSLSL